MSERKKLEAIAAATHMVNRAWCKAHGDESQPLWSDAPEWQRQSAIQGVGSALADPDPSASHRSWLACKERDGWVYGEVKDPEAKTHPCMVPYDELPPEQRAKDGLFVDTVLQIATALGVR